MNQIASASGKRFLLGVSITGSWYKLTNSAFSAGGLQRDSYVRPGKLFTANEGLFSAHVGTLKPAELTKARSAVTAMILEKQQ
jgi:hypothetical protein